MIKGFGIYVKNDLLDYKHYEQMGKAVWLYMWLLDAMTSINDEGIGKVAYGKPISYEDFSQDLKLSKSTYLRYVTILEEAGYINLKRAPYGFIITINKAVKIFKNKYPDKSKYPESSKVTTPELSKMKPELSKIRPELSKVTTLIKTIHTNTNTIQEQATKKSHAVPKNSPGYLKARATANKIKDSIAG